MFHDARNHREFEERNRNDSPRFLCFSRIQTTVESMTIEQFDGRQWEKQHPQGRGEFRRE
jgi:hypothetical protein